MGKYILNVIQIEFYLTCQWKKNGDNMICAYSNRRLKIPARFVEKSEATLLDVSLLVSARPSKYVYQSRNKTGE